MKKKSTDDFEHLLNWVDGRLTRAEIEELEAQLIAADSDTQAIIEWLQEFRDLSQKYLLVTPPVQLDERLYNIFTRRSEAKSSPRFFQRVLATLTFDSYHHLSAVGVRAPTAPKLERQLVYDTDLAEIALDLQWNPQEKSVQVTGQLFPVDDADETIYMVELQSNAATMKMVPTDQLGKFAFTSLNPGTYDILLSGDQNEIVLTSVELQI